MPTGKNVIIILLMAIMFMLLLLPAPLKTPTVEIETVYQVVVKSIELREFESVRELEYWIARDKTNCREAVPQSQDCDEYAFQLSQNATDNGYYLGIFLDRNLHHLMCITKIGGSLYVIEPQTDCIDLWVPMVDDDWH